MEKLSLEMEFLLSVNKVVDVSSYKLQDYLKDGYKIIGVSHEANGNETQCVFTVGKHDPLL